MLILSQSRLNKIESCFGQYYYSDIKRIKIPWIIWPGTLFGSIAHEVAESAMMIKNEGADDRKVMKAVDGGFAKLFDSVLEKQVARDGKFQRTRYYNKESFISDGNLRTLNLIKEVLLDLRKLKWKKLHPEANYNSEYNDQFSLDGTIDLLVELEDGDFRIFDYKTTANLDKFLVKDFSKDFQSIMYEHLVKKKTGKKVLSFTYYAQSSKEDSFLKNHHEIKTERFPFIEQKISDLSEKIKRAESGDVEYTPEKTTCKFCAYSDMCPKAV